MKKLIFKYKKRAGLDLGPDSGPACRRHRGAAAVEEKDAAAEGEEVMEEKAVEEKVVPAP
jgi:hypothetical protein